MPAKKTTRVKLSLHNPRAKVFTSEGPLVHGSIVDLPSEEARRYIERGTAHLSAEDEQRIEPEVNIEGGTFGPSDKPLEVSETVVDTPPDDD